MQYEYVGHAFGKGRQIAKTEMEKLELSSLTCAEVLTHAARLLLLAHEDSKDKEMIMDIAWMGEFSGWRLEQVPRAEIDRAAAAAQEAIDALDE